LKAVSTLASAAKDEPLSQVVRRALREYVARTAQGELPPTRKTAAAWWRDHGRIGIVKKRL